jgi:hypothetical protein
MEFSNQKVLAILKQDLAEAVEKAYAHAYALLKMEDRADPRHIEACIAEQVAALSAKLHVAKPDNVVNFPAVDLRGAEPVPTGSKEATASSAAQELIVATLRQRHEASIRELQAELEEFGVEVTPGNLSVILSRLNQSGTIMRSGRGMYKIAG